MCEFCSTIQTRRKLENWFIPDDLTVCGIYDEQCPSFLLFLWPIRVRRLYILIQASTQLPVPGNLLSQACRTLEDKDLAIHSQIDSNAPLEVSRLGRCE